MTALDQTPSNLNFLNPFNFQLQIQRLPDIVFFLQDLNIPGIGVPSTKTPTPFSDIKNPGDKANFNVFTVAFKLNETLTNYIEIYNWIKGVSFPETYDQYASLAAMPTTSQQAVKSEMSIIISNSQRIPYAEIILHEAFPVLLGDLNFSTRKPDIQFITCIASFEYTNHEFKVLT